MAGMRFSQTQLFLRYVGRFWGGFVLILFVMTFCGFMLTAFFPVICRDVQLILVGEETVAAVKNKTNRRGGKGNRMRYYLDYQFSVANDTFHGRKSASRDAWEKTALESKIDVVYLPSAPKVNKPRDQKWNFTGLFPLAFAGLLILGGITFFIQFTRDVLDRIRIISRGTPALATIEQVNIRRGRKGRKVLDSIRYFFEIEEGGKKHVHHVSYDRTWFLSKKEVKEGAKIFIVYDPECPSNTEVDLFDARRDDRLLLATGDMQAINSRWNSEENHAAIVHQDEIENRSTE